MPAWAQASSVLPAGAAPDEPCCHNYMLVGSEPGQILPIPYDFDMSGIVNAPYAEPNERFDLRSVRQRLYRGRCSNNEHIAASIEAFVDKKPVIYDLVNDNEFYKPRTRDATRRFLDGFYETISNPKRVQAKLVDKCLG